MRLIKMNLSEPHCVSHAQCLHHPGAAKGVAKWAKKMLSLANGNLLRGAGVRRILRVCCKQLHLSGKARMASGKLVVSMKRIIGVIMFSRARLFALRRIT